MQTRSTSVVGKGLAGGCVLWLSAAACAQTQGDVSQPLLAGPSVRVELPPGMENTFGQALKNSPMVVRDSVSMGDYVKMVRGLEGEAALSAEQVEMVKGFETGWRHTIGAYYATVLEDLESIQGLLPEDEAKRMGWMVRLGQQAKEQGWSADAVGRELAAPIADAMGMTQAMAGSMASPMGGSMSGGAAADAAGPTVLASAKDARGRLTQIRQGTPSPWEAQSGIWAELSEAQRDAMAAKLTELRTQRRIEREQREMRRAAQREGRSEDELAPTLSQQRAMLEEAQATGELAEALYGQLTDEQRASLDALEGEARREAVRELAGRLLKPQEVAPPRADGGKPAPSVAELKLDQLILPEEGEKKSEGGSEPATGGGD